MYFLSSVRLSALPQVFFPPNDFCKEIIYVFVSTIHRIYTFFAKVVFRVHETLVWNTPPDPADPADPADPPDPLDRSHELRLGPSLPRAPGARMTVVKTNSLK